MAHRRPHLFWHRLAARVLFLPTLGWNFLLGRILGVRHWWDAIDEHVFMGALPFRRDVAALQQLGVGAVVNTCEEYAGPVASYNRAGIVQLRIPTVDFTSPTLADVQSAVAFIQQHVGLGERVYVHCKAGRARSGTVVLGWLMTAHGMTPAEAQQRILQRRRHANPHLAQRPVVQQLWQLLHSTADCGSSAE
ncbi:MAG: dual specificity protein phosphatase family protein [Pirellulaceae bacterium]